ncbi:hypothetical protein U1Q18_031891 [Sarracenia purpurea var. burkii]
MRQPKKIEEERIELVTIEDPRETKEKIESECDVDLMCLKNHCSEIAVSGLIGIEVIVAENADLGLDDLVVQIWMERMLAKLVDVVVERLNLDLDDFGYVIQIWMEKMLAKLVDVVAENLNLDLD